MSTPLANASVVPSLTVDDLGRSIAFYEAVGFSISDRWDDNGVLTSVMMKAGAQIIALNQDDWKKGRGREKGIGTRLHVETTGNIDAIAAQIRSAGFPLDKDPYDTSWKTRQVEVTDPSGFKLSISTVWSR